MQINVFYLVANFITCRKTCQNHLPFITMHKGTIFSPCGTENGSNEILKTSKKNYISKYWSTKNSV